MEEIRVCTATKLIDNKRYFIANIEQHESYVYVETDTINANRAIIVGLSQALEHIPNKSRVKVLSPSNFGFKYLRNSKKWDNRDVGKELLNVINNKGIKVNFVDYSKLEGYKDIKLALKKKLKLKYVQPKLQDRVDKIVDEDNNVFNLNENTKYDVELYVRGIASTNEETKPGRYMSVMTCKGKNSEIYGETTETTEQRMVLTGIIESLKKLKSPCNIKIYTHLQIGLASYNKSRKGENKDLKEELLQMIRCKGHAIRLHIENNGQHLLIEKINNNHRFI